MCVLTVRPSRPAVLLVVVVLVVQLCSSDWYWSSSGAAVIGTRVLRCTSPIGQGLLCNADAADASP